jgi:hypothetical protein
VINVDNGAKVVNVGNAILTGMKNKKAFREDV